MRGYLVFRLPAEEDKKHFPKRNFSLQRWRRAAPPEWEKTCNQERCVRLSSSAELTKYRPYIHELNPQHVKRATKARGFQLDHPLYLGAPATKLPLKPFKGAKLVLTSVIPCRWKRVPFVINEVTNHFIKRFSHTHTPRRFNPPPLHPTGSHH